MEESVTHQFFGRRTLYIPAPETYFPGGHLPVFQGQQAGDALQRGGFARTIGTEERHNGALRHPQRQAPKNLHRLVVDHLDIIDFQ